MAEHVKKDEKTDKKGANKISRIMNQHAKDFVKILGIGKAHGQSKRAIANVTVQQNGEIPVLSLAHKILPKV